MHQKHDHETGRASALSRRGFLKQGLLAGAAFCAASTIGKAMAAGQDLGSPTGASATDEAHAAGMATLHRFRTLGSGTTSFKVSSMGFGVMGMNHHRSQSPDRAQCIRLIRSAAERGVTLFDTAIVYGPLINEELAGEALEPFKGCVHITTKFGHEVIHGKATGRQDSRPETIRRYCEGSLRRLRIDSIPLFYQHRFDPNTPVEEVAGTIAELIKEGKVQRWGMCEVNADTIRRAHAVCPLTAIQSEYHLMHRTVEANGVLDACEELGIGFVPYSPINRGFLGGGINEYTRFDPSNDNRQTLPRFQPEAIRANTRIVEALNAFGRTRGITSAQVALAWLMNKRPYIVPIPGTTKLSHLEENLRAEDIRFTEDDMRELENAVAAIPVVGSRYDAVQEARIQK